MISPGGLIATLFSKAAVQVSAAVDAAFNYVSLLLNAESSSSATTNNVFVDSSSNNVTFTKTGSATQGVLGPFSPTAWSAKFPVKTDFAYIATTPAVTSAFSLGGDFTFECWIYPTDATLTGSWGLLDARAGATATPYAFVLGAYSGGWIINAYAGASNLSSLRIQAGVWTHVAVVRTGTTIKFFVNGQLDPTTGTWSGPIAPGTNSILLGNSRDLNGAGYGTLGYISNMRLVNGTALYTTSFTPSTAQLTPVSGTVLLTFQDSQPKDNSPNAFTVSTNGTLQMAAYAPLAPSASWTPAKGGSLYLPGAGSYLTSSSVLTNSFGSSDFTIEMWMMRAVAQPATPRILYNNPLSTWTAGCWTLGMNSTGNITLWVYNYSAGVPMLTSTGIPPADQWTHIAVTRASNTWTVFINGIAQTSVSSAVALDSGTARSIGVGVGSVVGEGYAGYLSDVRLTAAALYTADFLLPTSKATSTANTRLLLAGTNGAINDATGRNDIATFGTAAASTAQVKYGTSSMYFNGTTDYLTTPATAAFTLGTNDFTVEAWVYLTNAATNAYIASMNYEGTGGTGQWALYMTGASATKQLWFNSSTGNNMASTTVNMPANTWTHIAYSRSGTSGRFFVNGTQVGTTLTDSKNYPAATGTFYVGRMATAANYFPGYIDDLRVTKGVARYTANFTAPTQAFGTY